MSTAPVRLRLANYRKPFAGDPSALTPAQREQLQALVESDIDSSGIPLEDFFGTKLDEENYPMKALEYIDVIDESTGAIVANLLLYPYGDGAVVHHDTTRMIADIVQHGFTPHKTTTPEWVAAFAHAWRTGAAALGVDDPGHFGV